MKIISDEFLTGAMYAPFCRTLHAPMSEWEKDIQNMAELGYTCLHGFAEWHDIEYEKGHFDFSKVDFLVELCDKYGIKAILNIATQNGVGFYSPRWLMEEYRGTGKGMVDAQGQVVSQEEYVIPCMDDPIYSAYANRYLKAIATHFAGDNRVAAFVLWGEPSLHSPRPNGFKICYCQHTKAKFRVWLKEKYGNIQNLNEAWGSEGPSDYIDFSQVNPPTGLKRQQGGFCSFDDWCEYMEYNLSEHIKNADTIFKENGALQPTINEMLPGINNSIDPWKLAKCTDIVGVSLFGKPTRNIGTSDTNELISSDGNVALGVSNAYWNRSKSWTVADSVMTFNSTKYSNKRHLMIIALKVNKDLKAGETYKLSTDMTISLTGNWSDYFVLYYAPTLASARNAEVDSKTIPSDCTALYTKSSGFSKMPANEFEFTPAADMPAGGYLTFRVRVESPDTLTAVVSEFSITQLIPEYPYMINDTDAVYDEWDFSTLDDFSSVYGEAHNTILGDDDRIVLGASNSQKYWNTYSDLTIANGVITQTFKGDINKQNEFMLNLKLDDLRNV